MTNFMTMSDEEIVEYIDCNFHLFADERSDDFPAAHLGSLRRGSTFIIRREEGFAMVRKGTEAPFNIGAELMFLYVLPKFQRGGIGQDLIEQVKNSVKRMVPIELTCETSRRREIFERSGFIVARHYQDHDLYEMIWVPE